MILDAKPKEERRAFHGIPFSIKECYFVKNCDSTAGKVVSNSELDYIPLSERICEKFNFTANWC